MFEAIDASFGSNGLLTVRSAFYYLLVALTMGFFAVFIIRAIRDKLTSNNKSKDKPGSEHTTEIVDVDLDHRLK